MAAQGNEHDIRVRDDHREMPRFEGCCLTMESGMEMSEVEFDSAAFGVILL
jgi:hypothetical protein